MKCDVVGSNSPPPNPNPDHGPRLASTPEYIPRMQGPQEACGSTDAVATSTKLLDDELVDAEYDMASQGKIDDELVDAEYDMASQGQIESSAHSTL